MSYGLSKHITAIAGLIFTTLTAFAQELSDTTKKDINTAMQSDTVAVSEIKADTVVISVKEAVTPKADTIETHEAYRQHMYFRKVEIKGDLESFMKELSEKNGFKKISDMTLEGTFAGTDGVYIVPSFSCTSGTVFAVSAHFPQTGDWTVLEKQYLDLKYNLTELYGTPITSREKFIRPYRRGDGYEMKAITNGKYEYESDWELGTTGSISLKIKPDKKKQTAKVVLTYKDRQGMELAIHENKVKFISEL